MQSTENIYLSFENNLVSISNNIIYKNLNSEMNADDLSTDEILTMLQELSEEDVNKQLGGFWAVPLPNDTDDDTTDTNYVTRK